MTSPAPVFGAGIAVFLTVSADCFSFNLFNSYRMCGPHSQQAVCLSSQIRNKSFLAMTLLPIFVVGKSLACMSVYALEREIPSTCAMSSAFSARGS